MRPGPKGTRELRRGSRPADGVPTGSCLQTRIRTSISRANRENQISIVAYLTYADALGMRSACLVRRSRVFRHAQQVNIHGPRRRALGLFRAARRCAETSAVRAVLAERSRNETLCPVALRSRRAEKSECRTSVFCDRGKRGSLAQGLSGLAEAPPGS